MKLFRFAPQIPHSAGPGREVQVFQSETAEILSGPEPVQARVTLLTLAGLFLSLALIVLTMRVDRVVSSTTSTSSSTGSTTPGGSIVTIEPTIVLGALDQSIIKSINVREGQIVQKGDPLATLDPTFTTADVGALKAQVASLNAEIARCQAELAQKPLFDVPPAQDPIANPYIAMQRQYFLQRKAQYDAQVRSYDEQIAQLKATIVKYQNDQARYGDRAKISKEIEDMRATLAAAQVGSRLNLLTATDQKLEIQRALEFDRNAAAESQHQLDSTSATRDAFVQQWFGQVSQELVTAQGNRDTAAEQLAKANKHDELVRLEAPENSMVLKLAKLSPRSVLNAGDPLVYLAPLKSPLEAELYIAARDVGFIRVGDKATIKLDPFNFIEHGTAQGTVRSISEGVFTTDDNGQPIDPYYKARVTLDPVELHNVGKDFRLVPGMTLTGDIHVGTRSLFFYLISGVARGVGESMREP
jgi:hemolysin D